MILIAHRGNITGPNPKEENSPNYIIKAIKQGFDVEVDVWCDNDKWFLGHDEPQYATDLEFLAQDELWLHCKNYVTFQILSEKVGTPFNFFYHTNEDYVLTGRHYVWTCLGGGGDNTIIAVPEHNNIDNITNFAGVCSDYIGKYK